MDNIPQELKILSKKFFENNYKLYIVGGAVRSFLLDKEIKDYDLITDAKPDEIKKILSGHKILTHAEEYGVLIVVLENDTYEIATLRRDGTYKNNRHPDFVVFTDSLEKDLSRRDFTINTLVYDIINDKILDPLNSNKDLANKIIRTVGNPNDRFKEDGLRILRALRFAIQLNFDLTPITIQSCIQNRRLLSNISGERKRDELCKMLSNISCTDNLNYLNLALYLILDGSFCTDFSYLVRQDLEVSIASLFMKRDIEQTKQDLYDLRFPKKFIFNVLNLIKFTNKCSYKSKTIIKNLINQIGDISLARKVLILQGECPCKVDEIISTNDPIFLKDLEINGNDLIKLGYQKNEIGKHLNLLLYTVHLKPELNNIVDLTNIIEQMKIIEVDL